MQHVVAIYLCKTPSNADTYVEVKGVFISPLQLTVNTCCDAPGEQSVINRDVLDNEEKAQQFPVILVVNKYVKKWMNEFINVIYF